MVSEKLFEKRVRRWLQSIGIYEYGTPSHLQTIQPTGCYFKVWGGGMQKAGVPDLIICTNGIYIACELKAPKGKPSELQKKNIIMTNRGGGIGVILYPDGFDQFKNLVKGVMECEYHIRDLIALKSAHTSINCDILSE